jgi:hypothetical protein
MSINRNAAIRPNVRTPPEWKKPGRWAGLDTNFN